jgi:hypothetical protein
MGGRDVELAADVSIQRIRNPMGCGIVQSNHGVGKEI